MGVPIPWVHVTYLDVLYLVPVRTHVRVAAYRRAVATVLVHVRSHRFERRAWPKPRESDRTAGSRLSRSSPDATSSQYRVSPLAELVSDLCQSRASRHSPSLTAGGFRPFIIHNRVRFRSFVTSTKHRDSSRLDSPHRGRIPFSFFVLPGEPTRYTLEYIPRVGYIYAYMYIRTFESR